MNSRERCNCDRQEGTWEAWATKGNVGVGRKGRRERVELFRGNEEQAKKVEEAGKSEEKPNGLRKLGRK